MMGNLASSQFQNNSNNSSNSNSSNNKKLKVRTKPIPKKSSKLTAPCIGELFGHTGSITSIQKINENSFLTGGIDCQVIIWKDGKIEMMKRNQISRNTKIT